MRKWRISIVAMVTEEARYILAFNGDVSCKVISSVGLWKEKQDNDKNGAVFHRRVTTLTDNKDICWLNDCKVKGTYTGEMQC